MIESIKAENWSSTHQSGGARPPDLSVGKNLINWQMSNNWNLIFPHKILPPGFVFCFQFKVRIWFKGHFTNRIYCQGIYYVGVCDCMFSCVHFLIKRRSCLQHISSAGSNIPNSCFWCQIFSRNFNLVRIPGWAETGIVGLRRAQVTSPGLPLNLF